MSNIYCNFYLQISEEEKFFIKEDASLDELANALSRFFEKEDNWHEMKECWLSNGQSDEFQNLMKEALLGAYGTFVIDDSV